MRRGIVVLSAVLLASVPGFAATAAADFDVVADCHDGQSPTRNVACDADSKANGACTIGEHGGKSVTASVGGSVTWTSPSGVVGRYTCLAAKPLAPSAASADEGSVSASKREASGTAPVHRPSSANAVFLYPPEPGGLPTSSPSRGGSKGGGAKGGAAPKVQQWKVAPAPVQAANLAGATKAYTSGLAGGARKASATAGAVAGRR